MLQHKLIPFHNPYVCLYLHLHYSEEEDKPILHLLDGVAILRMLFYSLREWDYAIALKEVRDYLME